MNGTVSTMIAVLCVLACFNVANAGLGTGGCPQNKRAMKNFNLAKYAGRWFENGSFGTFFEWNGKCVQALYTPQDDGISVVNTMVDKSSLQTKQISGWAKPVDDSGDGKLAVTFPMGGFNRTGPYWVLDTDYENYSIVYSCANYILFHYDLGWILTRKPELENQYKDKVEQVLTSNGLKMSQFTPQVQDCGVVE